MTDMLIEVDTETLDYLRERAEHMGVTPAQVAMQEIIYARNRRRALKKDAAKPKEARKCRHVGPGEVCATCGREGK